MWQCKLVIKKKRKKLLTNYSITSIWYSPPHRTWRNTAGKTIASEKKGNIPFLYFQSWDKAYRIKDVDFPWHHSQSQSSPSENFGKFLDSGKTLGRSRYPTKKHLQKRGKTPEDPATREEILKDIGGNRDARSCGSDWEKFLTTSEPPPKTSDILKEIRTLKNRVDHSINCPDSTQLRI